MTIKLSKWLFVVGIFVIGISKILAALCLPSCDHPKIRDPHQKDLRYWKNSTAPSKRLNIWEELFAFFAAFNLT